MRSNRSVFQPEPLPPSNWPTRPQVVSSRRARFSSADRIPDIAIRFWSFTVLGRDQKLFPHFGETGKAILAVKQVKYGGHDRTPSFDSHYQFPSYHFVWDARRDLNHNPTTVRQCADVIDFADGNAAPNASERDFGEDVRGATSFTLGCCEGKRSPRSDIAYLRSVRSRKLIQDLDWVKIGPRWLRGRWCVLVCARSSKALRPEKQIHDSPIE